MRTLQRQAQCQLIKHAHTVEKEFYARLLLPANPKCSDSVISSAVALGALSTTESQQLESKDVCSWYTPIIRCLNVN